MRTTQLLREFSWRKWLLRNSKKRNRALCICGPLKHQTILLHHCILICWIIASRWTILEWYTMSRQVSVLALCFLMKCNGIVRGWWMVVCMWILFVVLTIPVNHETRVTLPLRGYLNWVVFAINSSLKHLVWNSSNGAYIHDSMFKTITCTCVLLWLTPVSWFIELVVYTWITLTTFLGCLMQYATKLIFLKVHWRASLVTLAIPFLLQIYLATLLAYLLQTMQPIH